MPVMMIRYQVAYEGVAEVVEAIETAFAEVEKERPEGVRYAYLRRAGTTEFVALLELDEGAENPLPGIAAARRLQATVARWAVGPAPAPQPLDVLGAYRFFGLSGVSGSPGSPGSPDSPGLSGFPSLAGTSDSSGSPGAPGLSGSPGLAGTSGTPSSPSTPSSSGSSGSSSSSSSSGSSGSSGFSG
ncbi:hypothetical protein [Streptosporangium sp. NPDC002524]|uniref:hypothetical protein n=1 Tax=Streptosporangium sp. NPDC002524 TaxID=3154537 RepID=UPI00331819E4